MLTLKENPLDKTLYCENICNQGDLYCILETSYRIHSPSIKQSVLSLISKFDKMILVDMPFVINIGLIDYCSVLQGESIADIYHQLLPYLNDYFLVEQLDFRQSDRKSYSVIVIPLPCSRLAAHYQAVVSHVRKSTIDELLTELC